MCACELLCVLAYACVCLRVVECVFGCGFMLECLRMVVDASAMLCMIVYVCVCLHVFVHVGVYIGGMCVYVCAWLRLLEDCCVCSWTDVCVCVWLGVFVNVCMLTYQCVCMFMVM